MTEPVRNMVITSCNHLWYYLDYVGTKNLFRILSSAELCQNISHFFLFVIIIICDVSTKELIILLGFRGNWYVKCSERNRTFFTIRWKTSSVNEQTEMKRLSIHSKGNQPNPHDKFISKMLITLPLSLFECSKLAINTSSTRVLRLYLPFPFLTGLVEHHELLLCGAQPKKIEGNIRLKSWDFDLFADLWNYWNMYMTAYRQSSQPLDW